MSKRQFKSQASSSRAAFGSSAFGGGFGSSTFGTTSSRLSYVAEPPDLSLISDANVVVAFKNVSKKDSITKAKALEDIQSYVSSTESIEDGILEAWIQIYPRTSIDSSRRVRQLAHILQGQIAAKCGKRIAPRLPAVVGAWLSGLYDNDKSVSRAAQDAQREVFSSPEKLYNLRKAYQQTTLEYCRDALEKESPLTLSDERSVSPDDADAKYARVIASALGVIGNLLTELAPEEVSKQQELYEEVLTSDKLWEMVTSKDPMIRRALYRLLKVCIGKQQAILESELGRLSRSLIYQGLHTDNSGSSMEFLNTLIAVTKLQSTIWTENYAGKKPPEQRLRSFLKKGSQGGPKEFWSTLCELFSNVPESILPKNAADAVDLLQSLHSGLIRKEEPRSNLTVAYDAYISISTSAISQLPDEEKQKVLSELLWPLIPQYLAPSVENTQWTIPPPHAAATIAKAVQVGPMSHMLAIEWPSISARLIEEMKTSAPEQSKDYEKSQNSVADAGKRWVTFQEEVIKGHANSDERTAFRELVELVLQDAFDLLKSRNGKPYGAAAVVENACVRLPHIVFGNWEASKSIRAFLVDDSSELISSPSMASIVSILYASGNQSWFDEAWKAIVKHALNQPDSAQKMAVVEQLLFSSQMPKDFTMPAEDADVQALIVRQLHSALDRKIEWSFVSRMLSHPSTLLSSSTTDTLLADLTQNLSVAERTLPSLQGLEQMTKYGPGLLRNRIADSKGTELLNNLLLLTESANDDIAQEASAVNNAMQALIAPGSGEPKSQQALFTIIQSGLSEASASSVTVETLVDLVKGLLEGSENVSEVIEHILPPVSSWSSSLDVFLKVAPKASLAITGSLSGAAYLVPETSAEAGQAAGSASRDAHGFSAAYRISNYVANILKLPGVFDAVSAQSRQDMFTLLSLSAALASDNLSLAGSNNFWNVYTPTVESDALEFVSAAQGLVTEWLHNSSGWWSGESEEPSFAFVQKALQTSLEKSEGLSSEAYYHALVYSASVSELIEVYGWPSKRTSTMEDTVRALRKSPNTLSTAAFVTAHRIPLSRSKVAERSCNEIVADLTGLDIASSPDNALKSLVLLNLMLYSIEDMGETVATQRAVFLLKHLLDWLREETLSLPLQAEVCRTLTAIFPIIKDMYGEHWGETLKFMAECWSNMQQFDAGGSSKESPVPLVHATLKLHATLLGLTKEEEPNDDLVESWKDSEDARAKGLINLLRNSQHFPDEFHQPLRIVNELLARQISKASLRHIDSTEELYPLLFVASGPVQKTAFDILHKQIPEDQEQISFDAALDNKTSKLPEELLSLILEAPTVDALADANFERQMPLPLRGYLFSWCLIFDHFQYSSYKVKSDYIDHLKDGDYLPSLLDFIFDFLGHSKGKPVDVTKFDPTTYQPDLEESPLQDTQWLLTHIYYLSLHHMPSLVKAWYIDCKPRQKSLSVTSWTEKFISPHIISASLASVSNWSSTQDTSEETLNIKVAPKAKEITASYTIDEQTMSIRIRLPSTYPLSPASVEGITRVAVNENKWQSWLRITQGVITFSNGNLIDGLGAFRRNVTGALKGQTECAICYSIVGADKQLPSKRCSTCKNLFHGSCLFKWFKSSNGSSCPLCRNLFHYG